MHGRRIRSRFVGGIAALIILGLLAIPATADHAWGNFHWARTSNPFTLNVADNVDSGWDVYLDEAITDWNASTVIQLNKVVGTTTSVKSCKATKGRIEVCNAAYGTKGWLGLAQIWTKRDHITQATAKLNDTYYDMPIYNTPAERRHVMCQEIAHDFGLDHQDEEFGPPNLGSCMDYTDVPQGGGAYGPSNEHPNDHDFDQLEEIYAHPDSTTTVAAATSDAAAAEQELGDDPSNWGQVVRRDGKGRPSLYRKDIGNDEKIFTFVIFADKAQGPTAGDGSGDDPVDGGKNDKQKKGKKDSKHKGNHDKRRG